MFDRMSDEARQVVATAEQEALSLGHGCIGTEHLLLGLLSVPAGLAGTVLAGAGLRAGDVRGAVERIVGLGRPRTDDAAALRSIGIDLDAVRASVEESFGPGALELARPPHRRRRRRKCRARPGQPALTPRSKRVLEMSLRESLRLGDGHIGTEHLLLALVAEGEGLGAMILVQEGLNLDTVRAATLAALGRVA